MKLKRNGFTLIEIIIGIVVLAISLVVITSFLAPLAKQGIEPLHQLRSAELGGGLLNEIMGKSYDQQSDHNNGGLWRCGETGNIAGSVVPIPACSTTYGPDGGGEGSNSSCSSFNRDVFNDVDDYDTNGQFCAIANSMGEDLAEMYVNFSYRVTVDTSEHGGAVAKRIDLTIRAPSGSRYEFSAYRWNY